MISRPPATEHRILAGSSQFGYAALGQLEKLAVALKLLLTALL
jgi:hypothetical protein